MNIPSNILPYILIVLGFLSLLSVIFNIYFFRKMRKLTKGASGKSLESIVIENKDKIRKIEGNVLHAEENLSFLGKKMKKNISTVDMYRYDALRDLGGKQSFSLILLDEHGDGILLTSLFLRDRNNLFLKEINHWNSERKLSEEEVQLLQRNS